jgi:hypothetical protein
LKTIGSVIVSILIAVPATAQTGTYVVRGRVTERGQDRAIAQAVVQLGEQARVLTNERGEFEIRGVTPGRHPLTVEALGYRTARTTILVSEDLSGRIELDPAPIPLDTVGVTPARFDLRGQVRDVAGGAGVPWVTVRVTGAGETSTNDAGGFRLAGLPRGRHVVTIEGFGWLPQSREIELDGDTTIRFDLDADPITQRIIAAQIERLSERTRSSGYAVRAIDRAAIAASRAATPVDVLLADIAGRIVPCPQSRRPACLGGTRGASEPVVYIDDRVVQCGLEHLANYPVASIQRVELFGIRMGSVGTIRAYTTWYIERLASGRVTLPLMEPYPQRFAC